MWLISKISWDKGFLICFSHRSKFYYDSCVSFYKYSFIHLGNWYAPRKINRSAASCATHTSSAVTNFMTRREAGKTYASSNLTSHQENSVLSIWVFNIPLITLLRSCASCVEKSLRTSSFLNRKQNILPSFGELKL